MHIFNDKYCPIIDVFCFIQKREMLNLSFPCVPSMVLILLVKVRSRVCTAKCSEPQVCISNGMDGGVDGITVEELGGLYKEEQRENRSHYGD